MRIPPPILALAAGVLQHRLAPSRRPGLLRSVAALGIGAASFALAGKASAAFDKRGTTKNPIQPEKASTLVTDGPFAVTRNPMYVGLTGLLTAHALLRGGLLTPLPVAAFAMLMDRTQIAAEEAALRAKFGPDYAAYAAVTPRWLDARSLQQK